jgi:4-carboxymuconolactone decarboxylase
MARVTQLTEKSQLPAAYHDLYDRIHQARGQVGGPYSILLHAPNVAERVDALSQVLRESSLSRREFVLTALAVARAKDCVFVWSVQAPNARRIGVADEIIAAIGARRTDGLSGDERDLVDFAQDVVSGTRIAAELFDRLRAAHGDRWLVELTATAGHFALISGVNNAFDVGPLDGGEPLPE